MLADRLSRMLTAYVDGELNAHQRKAVLRLLRRSPEARALLRQLQMDANQLRQLPQLTLSSDFADLVMQRIADGIVRPAQYKIPTSGSPVPVSWGLAAAAAVLLAVGLGSYFLLSVLQGERQATRDADDQIARVDPGKVEDADAPAADDSRPSEPMPVVEPVEEKKREKLGPPLIATPNPDTKPVTPLDRDENKLGIPAQRPVEFERPNIKLATVLKLRELNEERGRKQLRDQLGKGTVHHLELVCLQPVAAMERLKGAFQAQGIRLVIDDQASSFLKVGVRQPSYALYTENVKSDEVTSILEHLNREDRKIEAARRGPRQFDGLIVSGMTDSDHKLLAKLLGIDPTQLEAPRKELSPQSFFGPKRPAISWDVTKSLSETTEKQVRQALTGQGTPRPVPGKTVANPAERLAIVVAVNSPRTAKSQEVKLFLDSRKERSPGTVQMLLILRGKGEIAALK